MGRRTLLTLAVMLMLACGPVPTSSESSDASGGTTISAGPVSTTGSGVDADENQVCSGLQVVKDLVHEIALASPDLSDEVVATADESEAIAIVEQANATAQLIDEILPEMRSAFDSATEAAPSEIAAEIRKLRDWTLAINETFVRLLGEMNSLDELPELEERYADPTSFTMLVVAQGQAVESVDEYLLPVCGFTLATSTSAEDPSPTTTVEVPMTQLPDLLPLGSPGNVLGNSCAPGQAGCENQPAFWANISGKWVSRPLGDAFSAACLETLDEPGCLQPNDLYRDRGYLYGVEANGLSSFTIEFNDIAFMNTSGGLTTSDDIRTGDRGCEDWEPSNAVECGPTMLLNLFAPETDPLDLARGNLLCSVSIPPAAQVAVDRPYVFASPASCFTVNDPEAGTYFVEVRIVDPGAKVDRSGLNRYSLRSSEGTRLFGVGDMSVYTDPSVETDFFLAEVADRYAGNTFTVELFDTGEIGAGRLQMIDPRTNAVFDGTCHVSYTDNHTAGWANRVSEPTCEETVSRTWNGVWLRFQMDLPPDYTCGADCWWKLRYVLSEALAKDSFTWRAYIEG